MNRPKSILLILLFVTGCIPLQTPTATRPTTTPQPSRTEPPLTPTQKFEPTWTLPATLPVQDAATKVNELLQTNGGCRLPCWWGIMPGETRWEDARSMLFPVAESVDDSYAKEGEFFPGLLTYYSSDRNRFFEQDYTVSDGIVQAIKIKLPKLSPFSRPQGIFSDYGVPDKVYVGGNAYEPNVENEQYFSIILYYTEQRIFAYYGGGFQPIQPGPSLVICFPDIDYVELHLFGPTYPFDQTRDSVFKEHGNRFQSLEDVTELTNDEFFRRFTSPTDSPCFETPAQKWLP